MLKTKESSKCLSVYSLLLQHCRFIKLYFNIICFLIRKYVWVNTKRIFNQIVTKLSWSYVCYFNEVKFVSNLKSTSVDKQTKPFVFLVIILCGSFIVLRGIFFFFWIQNKHNYNPCKRCYHRVLAIYACTLPQ